MLLSVQNLSTHFNAGRGKIARAVDGVSFDLQQGKTPTITRRGSSLLRAKNQDLPPGKEISSASSRFA